MSAGDISHVAIDGVMLSTSLQTIYTVPAGKTAIFLALWACNQDSVARQLYVQIAPSGNSPGSAALVIAQSTITALNEGETERYVFDNLEAGDAIKAQISSGASVSMRGGVTLKEN